MMNTFWLICLAILYPCANGVSDTVVTHRIRPLVTPSSQPQIMVPPNSCLPSFTKVFGSCYKLLNVNGTHSDALQACQKLGRNVTLATIRCQAENEGILALATLDPLEQVRRKYIKSVDTPLYLQQYWIGLHDIKGGDPASGKWHTTGQNTYRNWARDEPNFAEEENACQIYVDKINDNGADRGTWNNIADYIYTWGAVCEEIIPTSGDGCREAKE